MAVQLSCCPIWRWHAGRLRRALARSWSG